LPVGVFENHYSNLIKVFPNPVDKNLFILINEKIDSDFDFFLFST